MLSLCLAHSNVYLFQSPDQSAVQASCFSSSDALCRSACITAETAKRVVLPTLSFSRTDSTATSNPTENTLNLSLYKVDDFRLLDPKGISCFLDVETTTQAKPENLRVCDRTPRHRSRVGSLVDKIRALQSSSSDNKTGIVDILDEDGELRSSMTGFNDLLSAFVIAREADVASALFSNLCSYGLAPDCWTYCIMIRCYCEKNEIDEATRVLHYLLGKEFYPNVATFTIVINAFCKRGRLQKAMEIFELMEKTGCRPTIQTYNCLLKGLCYVGKVEQAFEMLMDIKNKARLKPDMHTYTSVMDGLCKVGRSDEAKELLDEAMEMGLQSNVIAYNTLFEGYSKEGRPQRGISILKQMKARNCIPDFITYNTLFRGLLKWDKMRAALWVYYDMLRFGFEMNTKMMNSFLRKICRKSLDEKNLLEHANQVFEKMKSKPLVMDMGTFALLIRALCAGDKADDSLVHLNYITSLGYCPLAVTFDKVIQALCAKRKAQDAVSVLVLMYESRKTASKNSYDLLIKEFNEKGHSLEACCLYGAVVKNGMTSCLKPNSNLQCKLEIH